MALAEAKLGSADPRNILSLGYVLVTGKDNKVLKVYRVLSARKVLKVHRVLRVSKVCRVRRVRKVLRVLPVRKVPKVLPVLTLRFRNSAMR